MRVPIYCVKCKTKTETCDPEIVKTANKRYMLKGKCEKCNTNKSTVSAGGVTNRLFAGGVTKWKLLGS